MGCLRWFGYAFAALLVLSIVSRLLEPSFPYRRLRSIADDSGNVMDIYVVDGVHSVENLRSFCSHKKRSKGYASRFYLITVFDSEANAVDPTTKVLTGEYGMVNASDREATRHIVGTYTFSRVNGFSEMRYYARNEAESLAIREKID